MARTPKTVSDLRRDALDKPTSCTSARPRRATFCTVRMVSTRSLSGIVCTGLLCLWACSCGSPRVARPTDAGTTVIEHITTTSRALGPLDPDDFPGLVDFGHAAGTDVTDRISALIRRYYSAAVAVDGRAACSMLYSVVLRDIVDGDAFASEGLRRGSCTLAMYTLFRQRHRRLIAERRSLTIVRVRTDGLNGRVMLRFGIQPEARELDLRLVDSRWRIAQALDHRLP